MMNLTAPREGELALRFDLLEFGLRRWNGIF